MVETSLRDRIRGLDDSRSEVVDIPEWKTKLEVRSMSSNERVTLVKRFVGDDGVVDYPAMYPMLVIATAFDTETGERVFIDGDQEWLGQKNAGVLERLAQAASKLSGLTPEAVDEAGEG